MRKNFLVLSLLMSLAAAHSMAQGYLTRITVAQDGSGNFTSIQKAIESCKAFPYQRITVFIKKGIYKEKIRVPSWNTMLSLVGQDKDSVIITYDDYFGKINKGPNSTFYTPTVQVDANDCCLQDITIENSAGPVGQAIALSVEADRCVVDNCNITGNQDALYASGQNVRQYFRHCTITGTTDFIFGEATVLFDSCTIVCKADSYITAASTPLDVLHGFVFKSCRIRAMPEVHKVMLGRPWRKYAKTVFINCAMGDFIAPEGWLSWANADNKQTVFYAEYHSNGAGAKTDGRVTWSHQLSDKEAAAYTMQQIFNGWNP